MGLNERIKLSKWADILSNNFQAYVNLKLKPYDLKFAEFICLLNLYENDGSHQDFIIKRKYTDKSAITRTLQSLEKKGFVRREKSEEDKRINCVYLTEKALDYFFPNLVKTFIVISSSAVAILLYSSLGIQSFKNSCHSSIILSNSSL